MTFPTHPFFRFRLSVAAFALSCFSLASVSTAEIYQPINTQAEGENPPTAEEATALITLPPGFSVSLFAGEPDVRQPIAMNLDDRGRLWVAESYSYKEWEMKGEDRIVIFEDTDNDGQFDSRKIFYDKAKHLSGFAIGFGGIWICNSPNLEFIPDRDGDDVPDGPAEVVLDGFTTKGSHNFFNGLKWGPDGWLYGRHGILAPSFVGVPGTAKEERVEIDCGIFRVHPVSRKFEVVVRGTTNPWGLDWNEMGEMFMTGNVNGHLWHVIPGAYYPRMFGQGFYPHVYDRIQNSADHLHYVGDWRDNRKNHFGVDGPTDELGGGASHCGAMIYLGDNWPEEYRGSIFMSNTHGRRINNDSILRKGSGFTSKHREDFMNANHPWYRGVTQLYGPDGGVYFSDWTDNGECHDNDGVHRTSGRIYKVIYGDVENPGKFDLGALSDLQLVEYQLHENDWYVRQSRRILQERFVEGRDLSRARSLLSEQLLSGTLPADRQLRLIWALHGTGGVGEDLLTDLLDHENEYVRSWAVRLIGEEGSPNSEQFAKIRSMARDGQSRLVRLYIASTFPRFDMEQRWGLADDLSADFGYDSDQNLPQMIWYGLEPLVGEHPVRGLTLLEKSHDLLVYRNIARRIASDFDQNAELIPGLISTVSEETERGRVAFAKAGLTGIGEALNGLKNLQAPGNWSLVADSKIPEIRELALSIAPVFEADDAMGIDDWMALLDNATRRNQAIRELAAFDDPSIPERLLKDYRRYGLADRDAALATLSSRAVFAEYLLQAMRDGQMASKDVPAFYARQIVSLGDENISTRLQSIWGKLRNSPAEKVELIQSWQDRLKPDVLAEADMDEGKRLFEQTCASCHSLYGEGGHLGPELNGADRSNLYYVLENIIDPGAVLPRDYWMTVLTLKNGRVLSGTVSSRSTHTLTIVGLTGEEVVPHADIEKMEQFEQSTMPEGLLQSLSENEVRDLVAYLQWK